MRRRSSAQHTLQRLLRLPAWHPTWRRSTIHTPSPPCPMHLWASRCSHGVSPRLLRAVLPQCPLVKGLRTMGARKALLCSRAPARLGQPLCRRLLVPVPRPHLRVLLVQRTVLQSPACLQHQQQQQQQQRQRRYRRILKQGKLSKVAHHRQQVGWASAMAPAQRQGAQPPVEAWRSAPQLRHLRPLQHQLLLQSRCCRARQRY
jgi:hypothetical protein